MKCKAYAKALHYKELEFHATVHVTSAGVTSAAPELIEDLITVNNLLQQPEAAVGMLVYAQQQHSVELKESW